MVQHYPSLSILPEKIPKGEKSHLLIRQLITAEQAPHFIMQSYEIPPQTSHKFHSEKGERELYLLSGQLDVSGGQNFQIQLSPNDFLYIPPDNSLEIINRSDQPASFLTILPKSGEVSSNLPHPPHFLHGHFTNVEAASVTKFDSTLTTIRVLINENQAHQMLMRRFEIAPGGTIGVHQHDWEHEMFVLEGKMSLTNSVGDGHEDEVHAGNFIFMPPNESHGYINKSTKRVVFICMIPNLIYL